MPRRQRRGLAALLLSLAGLIVAPSPSAGGQPSAPASPAPAPATAQAASLADRQTDALMNALKRRDYAGAYRLFDASMKEAVSEAKLKSLWEEQLEKYGSVASWAFQPGAPARGLDVRLGLIKFAHGELKAMVAVDPSTGLLGGFFIKPPPVPAPPASYIDPSKFQSLEVSVGSEPFVLGGTLTVPVGKGPFPAAVLIHGSGPQDRDETIGPNKVFRDIAEGLSSKGVVVLRYEKRTRRYAKEMKPPVTIDDEVILDAVAAVNLLRSRSDVDRARIFVIGHSLGAQLAPEIAVRAAPVAGLVLLAPPGRPPWELVLDQMRTTGASSEDMTEAKRKAALLQEGKLGDETFLGAGQAYWQDWASRDGIAMAKKAGCPILILRGDRDFQVAEIDVANWQKGLAGTPNVTVATLPNLNHFFMKGSGPPGSAEYDVPGHVDPGLIEKIRAFIGGGK